MMANALQLCGMAVVMLQVCDVMAVMSQWLCGMVVVVVVALQSCHVVVVRWHGDGGSSHVVLCCYSGGYVVLQWLHGWPRQGQ
jgi:hypothetical protein